jgi:hypothetical protein
MLAARSPRVRVRRLTGCSEEWNPIGAPPDGAACPPGYRTTDDQEDDCAKDLEPSSRHDLGEIGGQLVHIVERHPPLLTTREYDSPRDDGPASRGHPKIYLDLAFQRILIGVATMGVLARQAQKSLTSGQPGQAVAVQHLIP